MTKTDLLKSIEQIVAQQEGGETDPEAAHAQAEALLLRYIDDAAITTAYRQIERWYA